MRKLIESLIAITVAIALSLVVVVLLGENPWNVLKVLATSAFGGSENISYSLFYATPLIFTGLSVAVAFYAGLFNIGGEGQLYMGSLFLTLFALKFPGLSFPLSVSLALLASFLGGGLWGALAGFLKAKRGSHEVIVTIMLNFISYAICGYMILGPLKSTTNQNPETAEIASGYFLHNFSANTPLNTALFLALTAAALVWFLLFKTHWGFEVRMVGSSQETARRSGINISRRIIQAMFLSGGLAGLVAVNEILGNSHKFKDQYSSGVGFVGIAVALLARNLPLGIIFSALLFGALSKGALDLELDTEKITRDMALMIQGIIILMVASQELWRKLRRAR